MILDWSNTWCFENKGSVNFKHAQNGRSMLPWVSDVVLGSSGNPGGGLVESGPQTSEPFVFISVNKMWMNLSNIMSCCFLGSF